MQLFARLKLLKSVLTRIAGHPMNRDRKFAAIWRFFHWQIRSRLRNKPLVVNWIGGAKFVARAGDSGLTGNIYTGLLDFEEMSFVLHALRPGDVFIDVGANAGSYTILASKVAGAHSCAFEPVPQTYERLLANVEINQMTGLVKAHNIGLAAEPGALRFSSDSDRTKHVVNSATSSLRRRPS